MRAFLLSRQMDYAVVWKSTWLYKLLGFVGRMGICLLGIALETQLLNLGTFKICVLLLVYAAIRSLALVASFSKRLARPNRLNAGIWPRILSPWYSMGNITGFQSPCSNPQSGSVFLSKKNGNLKTKEPPFFNTQKCRTKPSYKLARIPKHLLL